MSQDEVEQILPGWQDASQDVAQELAEWRRAHPKATLTQIEDAVGEAMQKLQARALGQVVHARAVADVAAQPGDERPRCPTCGGQLEPRGRQRRRIRPARQRTQLDLARSCAGGGGEVKPCAGGGVGRGCDGGGGPEGKGPDLSSFSGGGAAEPFTGRAYGGAHRRGTETATVVCAVQDGAEWEQGLVDVLRADA